MKQYTHYGHPKTSPFQAQNN